MGSFVIYNPTSGDIAGVYSVSGAASMEASMTANTPTGAAALTVPDSHPVVQNQSGWQVVNGALAEITLTPAQQLAAAQTTQTALITSAYTAATAAPVPYMGTTFWCDKDSQTMLAHALVVFNQAGAVPSGFFYLDTTGKPVPMTLAQLQGLGAATAEQVLGAFQKRVSLINEINTATTVEAVQAVTW